MRPEYSSSDKESTGRTELIRYLERLTSVSSEAAYDRLAGYGFARRYAGGKIVADLCWKEVGYGSSLLAEAAKSVVGLTNSTEAADLARTAYPAPNVEYRKVNVPELPYPEDPLRRRGGIRGGREPATSRNPGEEARRVLKQDGVLHHLRPGQTRPSRGRPAGNGVPEFRDLLEHHFDRVIVYRQGAVAGDFVFPGGREDRRCFGGDRLTDRPSCRRRTSNDLLCNSRAATRKSSSRKNRSRCWIATGASSTSARIAQKMSSFCATR